MKHLTIAFLSAALLTMVSPPAFAQHVHGYVTKSGHHVKGYTRHHSHASNKGTKHSRKN